MQSKTYFFQQGNNPSRYNIAKALQYYGYQAASSAAVASFHEGFFYGDNRDAEWLEHKHKLVSMLQYYAPQCIPETYLLDEQSWQRHLLALLDYYDTATEATPQWILKPALLNNGEHIKLFRDCQQVYDHFCSNQRLAGPHVLQRYIDMPHLFVDKKYTIRLYVILSNFSKAYVYQHGYCNVSQKPYSNACSLSNMHLTNEHLPGEHANVQQLVTSALPVYAQLLPELQKILRATVSALDRCAPDFRLPQQQAKFDIFGFDFLVDSSLRPWLLEVNHGPHFPTDQEHALKAVLLDQFWLDLCKKFILREKNDSGEAFVAFKGKQTRLKRVLNRFY